MREPPGCCAKRLRVDRTCCNRGPVPRKPYLVYRQEHVHNRGPCAAMPRLAKGKADSTRQWWKVRFDKCSQISPNRACSEGFARVIKAAWIHAGVARPLRPLTLTVKTQGFGTVRAFRRGEKLARSTLAGKTQGF